MAFGTKPGEKVIFMLGDDGNKPRGPELFAVEFDNGGRREISINDARGRFVQFRSDLAIDVAMKLLQGGVPGNRVNVTLRAAERCSKCGKKSRSISMATGTCEPKCIEAKPAPKKKAATAARKSRAPRMRPI